MIVSWDENKNKKNRLKHGISFDIAKLVFNDEDRIELYDEDHSIYEDRYIVIGYVEELLVVIYTIRGSIYRIISARKATKTERAYYEQIHGR